ncbi:MAG: ABC transporter ATP-binding protein [Actinomycetota bacterium]|nr:ABC transporter ATP-binding protein [Actinomycetota bacterium]MED5230289.1 ABC transporter ATP-binding protein [Actinomycetota bacterium]
MNQPLLELIDVTAGYGRIPVIHEVNLSLYPGDIYALLGPNGGGKSTTLKACSRQIELSSGVLHLAGQPMEGVTPETLSRVGVCTIPEGKGIFPNLSVQENLVMMTHTGMPLEEIEAVTFKRFPQLASRRKQLAGTLSGGEQQMLAMSRALGTNPKILLLDELSMGLAPIIVRDLYQIVHQIAGEGIAVLVVEQFARTVLGVSNKAGIMVNGKIVREGDPSELEEELSAAYLGIKGNDRKSES